MTRHIVPSREVFHLWANESQSDARNSSNSVSFRDSMAFSYRAIIGRIVRNNRNVRAFLLSMHTWSVTTSKHQSYLRSAIPAGEIVFHVSHLDWPDDSANTHASRIADYLDWIASAQLSAKRARLDCTRDHHTARVAELIQEVKDYCRFFGLRVPSLKVDTLAADMERARKAEVKAKREREANYRKELAKVAEEWRNGERDYMPRGYPDTLLRVRATDRSDNGAEARKAWFVETSRGARVQYDVARYLFTTWEDGILEQGAKAGPYVVTRINGKSSLQIGCHNITMQEARRLAIQEHWIEDDATTVAA